MIKERLQKVMAHRGMCSRRAAERLIADQKVYVDGTLVTELGLKVSPTVTIEVKDPDILDTTKKEKIVFYYILMNKPIGYITSTTNEQGPSVIDLLVKENHISSGEKAIDAWEKIQDVRVYPVGRLDKDSEGLVLLTNDGKVTNKLTHPRYENEKEYEVTITGRVPKGAEDVLAHGMDIGSNEIVKGVHIKTIKTIGKRTIITVVLQEGKNRQIRRMFGKLNMPVIALKRTRIGSYRLKTLPVGKWVIVQTPE